MNISQPSIIGDVTKCTNSIKLEEKPLEIERFKAFPGCSDYSDEEAYEIIESLKALAEVLYHFKPYCIDNQLSVYLNQDDETNVFNIDSNKAKPVAA